MQNNPVINKENINRFLCENCGANMVFDPRKGQLACPYCESTKAIEQTGESITERGYHSHLRPATERLQPLATGAMQVTCETCGATVTFVPPETARNCDFCGGKIVAQPKSADPLVAPEGVLPFSITTQVASGELKSWVNSRWFAPSNLKVLAQPDKVGSVYIPYWTFDADTFSRYTGERGEYYYETQHYEENGEQKSRQVRHTSWHGTSGAVSRHFDNLYIPATKSLLPDYLKNCNGNLPNSCRTNRLTLPDTKRKLIKCRSKKGLNCSNRTQPQLSTTMFTTTSAGTNNGFTTSAPIIQISLSNIYFCPSTQARIVTTIKSFKSSSTAEPAKCRANALTVG